jgi:hypothetical protein
MNHTIKRRKNIGIQNTEYRTSEYGMQNIRIQNTLIRRKVGPKRNGMNVHAMG